MAKREGFFQHDGVRYRFAVWESEAAEAAPVVLLHGFAQSAASWDGVAEPAATGRRALPPTRSRRRARCCWRSSHPRLAKLAPPRQEARTGASPP